MSASGAEDRGSSPRGGTVRRLVASALVLATACVNEPAPPPTRAVRTATVEIPAYRFEPRDLAVGRGTLVSWENRDSDRHVIANSPSEAIPIGPDSRYELSTSMFQFTLDPGGRASFTFNETGTFYYFCLVHNVMKGTISVR